MDNNKKRYWKGIEELTNDSNFAKYANKEFPEYLPINTKKRDLDNENGLTDSNRRDFMKMMGFSVAAASLAACEAPVRKAIPYVVKPENIDPSIPNYYATTYIDGGDVCSLVVKTREGRPIKINGNENSSLTNGKVNAQIEASVLSLYDKERLTNPLLDNEPISWADLDKSLTRKLRSVASRGGSIRIVSNSISSPSTQNAINIFKTAYPGTTQVMYDPQPVSGIIEAHEAAFGKSVFPGIDLSRANVIVNFGADFLGTWVSPVQFAGQYAKTRKVGKNKKTMSRHYQYESNMSLTGANADYRIGIRPSQEGLIVGKLHNLIAQKAGQATVSVNDPGEIKRLEKAADELWNNRGSSLVLSASNDPAVQQLIVSINQMLGNYGSTLDVDAAINTRKGVDKHFDSFLADAKRGEIDAVIFYNANPVYDHARGEELASALANVDLVVSTSDRMDETTSLASYVAPDHHYLESWNDAEPVRGKFTLAQPTISPLFNTRQAQTGFLTWAGHGVTDYYEFLQANWKPFYQAQREERDFQRFWDKCLYNGVLEVEIGQVLDSEQESGLANETSTNTTGINKSAVASSINENYKASPEGLELVLYQKVGIGSGRQANNPWLHEMPDPITKACWDNYLTISQPMANEMGIKLNEGKTGVASLQVDDKTLEVPVLVQPGQARGTVGLALGYGRQKAGKVANNLGVNAYPLVTKVNGNQAFFSTDVTVSALDKTYTIAQTQTHQTYMGRETVIQEAKLPEYQKDPKAGKYTFKIETAEGPKLPDDITLWKGHEYPNHHWGMTIDLNSCIGCGACTVACQVENNIPVVGRQEVINRREMHWIRIDRYYSSDADVNDLTGLEEASDNPEVTFQPMMCQQCNNAPCETVCPVAATTHSTEGLNQMTYNRCIGTRYCANNCPYKVRRFNWFKYHDNNQFADVNMAMNDDLGKMVLNPDVTVRARGVMEKCTFCVQRIQAGKLEAKKERRRPKDGEIVTACAEACPTDAIQFGDLNDPESSVSQYIDEEANSRAYHVLQELRVSPNVYYMTKIRNKDIENA